MKTLLKQVSAFAALFMLSSIFFSAISEQLNIVNPIQAALIFTVVTAAFQLIGLMLGFKYNSDVFALVGGLNPEVWVKTIQDNIYQNNDFLSRAIDDSQYIKGLHVHIPQAGAKPNVVENRTTLPGTVGSRSDTDLTYQIKSYTTDPQLVQNFEEMQLSYPKRVSMLMNQMETLRFVVAQKSLFTWAPSGATRIVRSTGTASALNLPHTTATSTRKAVTIADVTRLKSILDKDEVPQTGRILLVPEYIYNNDFLNIAGLIQADQYGAPNMGSGVVARLMGFDIMIRSTGLVYDNTGTPLIKSTNGNGNITEATTDNGAILGYHPGYVSRAMGSIIPYLNNGTGTGDAAYYGHIFSSEIFHGAGKRRSDQAGTAAIVQTLV